MLMTLMEAIALYKFAVEQRDATHLGTPEREFWERRIAAARSTIESAR